MQIRMTGNLVRKSYYNFFLSHASGKRRGVRASLTARVQLQRSFSARLVLSKRSRLGGKSDVINRNRNILHNSCCMYGRQKVRRVLHRGFVNLSDRSSGLCAVCNMTFTPKMNASRLCGFQPHSIQASKNRSYRGRASVVDPAEWKHDGQRYLLNRQHGATKKLLVCCNSQCVCGKDIRICH